MPLYWWRLAASLFCLAALAPGSSAALPQTADPRAAALERLLTAPDIDAEWFDPAFLAKVPRDQVAAIIKDLRNRYGALRRVAPAPGGGFTVTLERADIPARVTLTADGRIAGLFFQPAVPLMGTLDDHVRTIAALPGRTSVLVTTNGRTRAAHEPDRPLAVGSAFKLAVLRAAAERVEAGALAWDRVVALEPHWRSLPSGILQQWPHGTPVTVATLANLMISISDNTATDALIALIGREAVEAQAPHSRPFLTTREASVLKADAKLRKAWDAADTAGRRALLAGPVATRPLPSDEAVTGVTLSVEWPFAAQDLCQLLEATKDLQPFRINPGPADPAHWRTIAFKGGSETGVLNLSTFVVAEDGTRHCVVATWNDDKALDHDRLFTPYRALLRALSDAR